MMLEEQPVLLPLTAIKATLPRLSLAESTPPRLCLTEAAPPDHVRFAEPASLELRLTEATLPLGNKKETAIDARGLGP